MKLSNLMILLFGVAIISGCSKDNSIAPDFSQCDQKTPSLKAEQVLFSGMSTFVAPGYPGDSTYLPNGKILVKGQTAEWYESSDEWRVTGKSFYYINWLVNPDGSGKAWGKTEIIVDGENLDDPPRGKWNVSWHGYLTPNPAGGFIISVDAVGTGKEGEVKGLVAKWTYTFDTSIGFYYTFDGSYH